MPGTHTEERLMNEPNSLPQGSDVEFISEDVSLFFCLSLFKINFDIMSVRKSQP